MDVCRGLGRSLAHIHDQLEDLVNFVHDFTILLVGLEQLHKEVQLVFLDVHHLQLVGEHVFSLALGVGCFVLGV